MIPLHDALVSFGIPVRNGERTLEAAIRSVLAQEHERLELVISDNASTDRTEALCRDLSAGDSRIVYYRQPRNVGLLNNFIQTMTLANGDFFHWLGDDDWVAPGLVARCLERFADDNRLILVTTQINYTRSDGTSFTRPYGGTILSSDDPIERFAAITSFQADGMPVDPVYSLMRRARVTAITRRNTLREDEVFTAKLALAGPWGHVPQVLLHRYLRCDSLPVIARRLGVPVWQAYMPTAVQCCEVLRRIREEELTPPQRRKARAALARMYGRRHYLKLSRIAKRIVRSVALPSGRPLS